MAEGDGSVALCAFCPDPGPAAMRLHRLGGQAAWPAYASDHTQGHSDDEFPACRPSYIRGTTRVPPRLAGTGLLRRVRRSCI